MTEQEFLAQLKKALKGLPEEDTREIFADYEEHFAAGLEAQKSEEEISASLGNPRTIGRSYKVDTALRSTKPGISGFTSAVFASLSLGLYNSVFVLGPFLWIVVLLTALWTASIALGLSGIVVIAGIILQPILPARFSIEGLNVGLLISASIGASSLGILSILGMWQLSKFFSEGTGRYLKFSAQYIRRSKEENYE